MTFRTKDGAAWTIGDQRVRRLREVYQGLDVWRELEKAALWIEEHPSRRKTARGMMRFVMGWLNKADREKSTAAPIVNARDRIGEPWHYATCPHEPKCGDYRACCELKRGLLE